MSAPDGPGERGAELPEGLALENWQEADRLRWTFQHVADFLPTATISRGDGPVSTFRAAPSDLDDIVVPLDGGSSTVGQLVAATETDGWIVLHDGAIVAEQYLGEMTERTPHLLMSVSKSLVGAVVAALAGRGEIDVARAITDYVPELADSGYAGATVRDVLDMRSGIAFSEDYLDPKAEVRTLEQAFGWAPREDPDGPTSMYEFLRRLRAKGEHGGAFEYRSCETDILGWVCEAVSGTRMPELMSELLWRPLGAEFDATIGIDTEGTGMFDGGINARLRDLARFGSLFQTDGASPFGQVIPAEWIAQTLAGAPDSREAFAASPGDNRMPGGMYRNQMWFPREGNDVVLALGIHGQMIYVNRRDRLVAAKVSSWPYPQSADRLFPTIAMFDAIAAALR